MNPTWKCLIIFERKQSDFHHGDSHHAFAYTWSLSLLVHQYTLPKHRHDKCIVFYSSMIVTRNVVDHIFSDALHEKFWYHFKNYKKKTNLENPPAVSQFTIPLSWTMTGNTSLFSDLMTSSMLQEKRWYIFLFIVWLTNLLMLVTSSYHTLPI